MNSAQLHIEYGVQHLFLCEFFLYVYKHRKAWYKQDKNQW